MRSHGLVAVVISGTLVAAYHVLQQPPPPELGIAPEMFDWSPGWVGRVFGVALWTLALALIIVLAVHFFRWLIGLWDRISPPRHKRPRQGGA